MRLRNITSAVMCFIDTDARTVVSPNIFRLDGLVLFCITMGLPFAHCELRYHSLSPTFYIKEEFKGSRSPPLPYHTLIPLTNSEPSVTHFVVLTTEQEHVESEAYSLRV